jgi:hypothetical protein
VRESLDLTPEEQDENAFWTRLYGPFEALDLDATRAFFAGFDRPWWVVGGWAMEAFTGVQREHEDIDVSLLARDVPALRAFVADRWHLWTIADGAIRPLTDKYPDPFAPDAQIWVRRDATSPWVMDVPLTPDDDGRWRNKRLPEHVAPLEEVTWMTEDGVRVLNPEIVLMYKARLDRSKDRRDLGHAWPLLDPTRRAWLRDVVRRLHPEHGWLELLGTEVHQTASKES